MTRRLLSAILAVLCWSSCAAADIDYSQAWCLGTSRLYPETVPAVPKAPRGYVPVQLSHYGRHGSRYITGKGQYEEVARVLDKAAADGMLTPLGEEIHARYIEAMPVFIGRNGELTPLGAKQQQAIAKRMVGNFPRLFKGRKGAPVRVEAHSTNLERTMLSMLNFEVGLLQAAPSTQVISDAARIEMGIIHQHFPENPKVRPADLQWKGLDAPWRPDFDRWCETVLNWREFCRSLFKDADYICSLSNPVLFERTYFIVAQSLISSPAGECGMLGAFSENELHSLGKLENYTFYVEKSRWPGGNRRGCFLSEVVLGDIIDKVPQDIADGTRVRLRFGHDGCIMALLAMMKMEGWDAEIDDPGEAWKVWDASRIPMACNLQFVIFAPRSKASSPAAEDLLVMMMLNEEPLTLNIPAVKDYYYRWTDFVAYCNPLLEEARAALAENR